MAKITRYDGNVVPFASESLTGEKLLFGDGTGTVDSDDLTDQYTSDFLRGFGSVGASDFPPLEWFNAQAFTDGQFISYLHQMGVAEWNAAQEYPTEGAQAVHDGKLWTRGTDWTLGDEPGVAGTTRWSKGIGVEDLGTAAYVNTGTEAAEIPTNLDVDNRVSGIETQLNKSITINFASDANLTLTSDQNKYGRISLTDTGSVLTAERELIVSDDERFLTVKNKTDYAIKVVTSSGTGVHVGVGEQFSLRIDGANVVSNGTSNKVEIIPSGATLGLTTYPFSLNQSNFFSIYISMTISSSVDFERNSTLITKEFIASRPSDWGATLAYYDGAQRRLEIAYTSVTSFTASNLAGQTAVGICQGFLQDGVTY